MTETASSSGNVTEISVLDLEVIEGQQVQKHSRLRRSVQRSITQR